MIAGVKRLERISPPEGKIMDVSEREWEQLWAKVNLLEARLGDSQVIIARLEEQLRRSSGDRAELLSIVATLNSNLTSMQTTFNKFDGGWKVMIGVASGVGFIFALVVQLLSFFRGK
jgi:hypothetical protein